MGLSLSGVQADPSWLRANLASPELRVIDASWYLPSSPRDALAEFLGGHVPGAVHLDLSVDLADPDAPIRNTLAAPDALARAFARAGIGNDHVVVVYDRLAGYSAGRVWWTLRYLGHARVAVLDGGFERWRLEGHPVSSERVQPPPARFEPAPESRWLVHKADVLAALGDPATCIVDARSQGRFLGREPESTTRRGHMPGARNVPHDANLAGDPPRFRPEPELRELYWSVGATPERRIITTCGSGVTASLTACVLTALGYPDVSVYDGSWAEWGNDPELPVEADPADGPAT